MHSVRVGLGHMTRQDTHLAHMPLLSAACVVVAVGIVQNPLLTTACLFGVAFTILALARPSVAVYALLIVVPFNDTASRFLHGQSATLFGAVKDYLLLLLLVRAWPNRKLVPKFLRSSLAALLAAAVIGGLVTGRAAPALYGFRNEVEPILLLIAVPVTLTRQVCGRALNLAVLLGEASAAMAIVTWHQGLSWLYRVHVLPVPSGQGFPFQFFTANNIRPRAFSPYVSADDLAVAMIVVVACVLFHPRIGAPRRFLLMILPLVATYLTRSRSGMLGVALVLLIWIAVMAEQKVKGVSPIIALFGFALAVAGGGALIVAHSTLVSDVSTAGHLTSFSHGLKLVLTHPLGVGLGTAGPRAVRYYANPTLVESSFLLLGLELGWLGLVAYLYMIWKLISILSARFRLLRDVSHLRAAFVLVGATALAGTIIPQFLLPTVQDSTVMIFLWVGVGLGLYAAMGAPSNVSRWAVARQVPSPPQMPEGVSCRHTSERKRSRRGRNEHSPDGDKSDSTSIPGASTGLDAGRCQPNRI